MKLALSKKSTFKLNSFKSKRINAGGTPALPGGIRPWGRVINAGKMPVLPDGAFRIKKPALS